MRENHNEDEEDSDVFIDELTELLHTEKKKHYET